VGSRFPDLDFHLLAGLLMPLAALALLWLEIKFLARALVEPGKPRPATLALPKKTPAAPDVQVHRGKGRPREYFKPLPSPANQLPSGQRQQAP
jgi:hypothetical protein